MSRNVDSATSGAVLAGKELKYGDTQLFNPCTTYVVSTCVSICNRADRFIDYGTIHPRKYSLGTTHSASNLTQWTNTTNVVLDEHNSVLTLDFGYEIAGFPFIITSSFSNPAQIEFKYAESFVSLDSPQSDGPWTFSNGLSNSFRVETFNITKPGYVESFFLQGGQRWAVVRLLTTNEVKIEKIGFRATSQNTEVDQLPGHLRTNHDIYNQIFELGGRVVQPSCVDAGNAPSTWEITKEGALVRGQTTAQSAEGIKASNYTLSFDTKIVHGGTGWRVASAIVPLGPYFVLTSNYPLGTTFLNLNRTLLPPNTLIFNSDWSITNQSSLQTPANQYYPIKANIEEGKWYRISTIIKETGYEIKLDGEQIAFVPLPPPVGPNLGFFASPSRYEGTWGFGGYEQHISYFKNVSVVSRNGTQIYCNPMMSDGTLAEYSVAPLDVSICLDGAKRDRLVWIGDFYHTVRVIAQSSARFDQLLGSIKYVLSYQNEDQSSAYANLVPISPALGSHPKYKYSNPSWAGLLDYQDLFLAGIAEYFRYTGDASGLKDFWPQIKKLATAKMAFIDPSTGLVAGTRRIPQPKFFLGPANGSAVSGLAAFTFQRLVPLANAFGDEEASESYKRAADNLRRGLNKKLWNDELGTYSLSTSSPGNFSLTGIAWAILSGAANRTQAESSIAKLEELRFGVGYRTISSDAESPDYQLAPNPSGFLLEALFQSRRDWGSNSTTATKHLLDNLWGSMVIDNQYSSGASWEYVKPNGSPGIDLFTSLAHPWGAAPTYVLAEYLLGVQPLSPGYSTFALRPLIGFLDINELNARVRTPAGPIKVSWATVNQGVSLNVSLPDGIHGLLEIPAGFHVQGRANESRLELLPGDIHLDLQTASP
ncbi:Six-hairpin glycosidase-like protein [Phaeosphaeriaceae sp. PMI808]|nr:Six-hairpin glycosidase-like protein [Phaeosphaeriaceae sp. PMI808]